MKCDTHKQSPNACLRHEQQEARRELGIRLRRLRPMWPIRGPGSSGWTDFLAQIGLSQSTANRYLRLVREEENETATATKPGTDHPREVWRGLVGKRVLRDLRTLSPEDRKIIFEQIKELFKDIPVDPPMASDAADRKRTY